MTRHSPPTLADVLVTPELTRRPARPPDYHAENLALAALLGELSSSPTTIFQRLVEAARGLTGAATAGLSVLDADGAEPVFRWPALVGQHAQHLGGTMPRYDSPCGVVLDRRAPQLFVNLARFYPKLDLDPPFVEVLLLPFFIKDQPVGTLWVVATDTKRQFDAEDVRILGNLSEFASTAVDLRNRANSMEASAATEVHANVRTEAMKKLINGLESRVKEATALAQQRNAELQTLAVQLEHAEHEERRKLARVLHDDLQQLLCAAQMHLGLARLEPRGASYEAALAAATRLVQQSIESSRSLATGLDPPVLREGELSDALEWVGRLMFERHQLSVTVEPRGCPRGVPEAAKRFVADTVRELLFNVVKHAGVREARVEAEWQDDQLRVVVEDRGAGFDPTTKRPAATRGGSGLPGVRERLALVGGEMTIESQPGRGTRATFWLPCRCGTDPR